MNKYESKYFRTAVKMDKALIEILETKDFEYITVKEICDKAHVNRSTFYLHYNNTVDLLEETKEYIEQEFISYFLHDYQTSVSENISSKLQTCNITELNYISDKYMHPFFKFIYENKRIFLTVLTHTKNFRSDDVFEKLFINIFDPILTRFEYPERYRKFVMLFYLNGVISVAEEWLSNDCKEPISEISDIIKTCILGKNNSFETMLNNTEKP